MASLSVRKLDKEAYDQLRILAAQHGVSMEEEARQIICRAVLAPEQISRVFEKHFGQAQGIDLDLAHLRPPHDPMSFDE